MPPIALNSTSNISSTEKPIIPWNNKIKSRAILPQKEIKKDEEDSHIQDQIIATAQLIPTMKFPQNNNNNNSRSNIIKNNNKSAIVEKPQSVLNQPKTKKPLKISSKPMAEEDEKEEIDELDDQMQCKLNLNKEQLVKQSGGRRRRSELLARGIPEGPRRPAVTNPSSRRHPRFEPLAVLLDSATRGDLPELRRLLARTHVPVNSCNSAGLTALHCAIANGHPKVAEFLLSKGAKVNVCDDKGWSPLHMAVANDDEEAVRLLLDFNADVEAMTQDNQTPLELSQEPITIMIEKMLQQKYRGKECLAMYDFEPQEELGNEVIGDELPFVEGEVLQILNRKNGDWWLVENVFGRRGYVPKTHLQ